MIDIVSARLRSNLLVGAVAGAGFALLSARALVSPYPGSAPLLGVSLLVLISVGTHFSGARGWLSVWVLLLCLWGFQLYHAAPIDGPPRSPGQFLLPIGLGVPLAFAQWSIIALPVFAAAWLWILEESVDRPWRPAVAATVVWILLSEAAWEFARIPWDVEPTPYPIQGAAWLCILFVGPIPIIVTTWMLRTVWLIKTGPETGSTGQELA